MKTTLRYVSAIIEESYNCKLFNVKKYIDMKTNPFIFHVTFDVKGRIFVVMYQVTFVDTLRYRINWKWLSYSRFSFCDKKRKLEEFIADLSISHQLYFHLSGISSTAIFLLIHISIIQQKVQITKTTWLSFQYFYLSATKWDLFKNRTPFCY